MTGFFEGTRQIVASEVMRLRSLGGRRRDAGMKTWLARQPSPKPAVEQDKSAPHDDAGGDSHTQSLLFAGGPSLTNSSGVPWTAAYVDSRSEPTCDLRSNIAAESRAKIIYERLINITDDPGIKEALGFLMTREIAHQKSFEKALYAITDNFPLGKLMGIAPFADMYVNTSQGEGDAAGPWNTGAQ
jgi:Mn-containing catalase